MKKDEETEQWQKHLTECFTCRRGGVLVDLCQIGQVLWKAQTGETMNEPPEHSPLQPPPRAPDPFVYIHEIPSMGILEAIWIERRLQLRVSPRKGEILELDKVSLKGIIDFLQLMQQKQPDAR